MVRWMRAVVACWRHPGQPFGGTSGQHHGGPARRLVDDSHVLPENASAEAGAQCLGTGFLGGKSLGVGGGALRPPVGFPALDLGEYAGDETLAIASRASSRSAGYRRCRCRDRGSFEPSAAGLDRRDCGKLGRQRIGRIGRDIELRERCERNPQIGLAARAVDQAGRAQRSRRPPRRCRRCIRATKARSSRCPRPSGTRAPFSMVKPRRKRKLAIDALEEDGGHAQLPAHLIADDDTAHGRRRHEIDLARSPAPAPSRQAPGTDVPPASGPSEPGRIADSAATVQARMTE